MVYVEFIDQIGEPMIGPEAKSSRKFKRFDMRKGAGRTYHWNLKRGKLNSVEKKRRYFVEKLGTFGARSWKSRIFLR